MEFNVGEMSSTVRVADSQSMLSPQVFERIVQAVLERLQEQQAHQTRVASERRLRPRASAQEAEAWE